MARSNLKKKYGIVILLDALGASEYNEKQIKEFLSARNDINTTIKALSSQKATKSFGEIGNFHMPDIFTFGDTVVITIELNTKKYIKEHLWIVTALMRRYLFHSFEKGIMYRGAFSIGNYVADSDSNTVMGDAVSDAASWYEQSEWMGLSSTPRTNNILEHLYTPDRQSFEFKTLHDRGCGYLVYYGVPMKSGSEYPMYVVDWPSAFFDETPLKKAKHKNSERYFLNILKELKVPKGTEEKYENTKSFFYFVANQEANNSIQPSAKDGG